MKSPSFISRWWQNFGFGIQSKTDFAFLHDVIKEKLPYYAYDDMKKAFPQSSNDEQMLAQLLFRLGNYIHPSEIIYCGIPSAINQYALNLTVVKENSSKNSYLTGSNNIICFVEGEGGRGVLPSLHNISLLVMTDINGINANLWKKIINCNSITYDKRSIGIAFFNTKRYSEHYAIL